MKTTELAKQVTLEAVKSPYTTAKALLNLEKKVIGVGFEAVFKLTVATLLHWQARNGPYVEKKALKPRNESPLVQKNLGNGELGVANGGLKLHSKITDAIDE